MSLREIYDLQVILFLVLFNPLIGLALWIDEQGPSLAFSCYYTVVDTQ